MDKMVNFFKNYWKEIGVVGSAVILITPLVIATIISFGNYLAIFDGSSSVWIGFWGSYLGGVVGTAGVIYVAFLQNRQQRELNKKQSADQRILNEVSMEEQRKLNNAQFDFQLETMKKVEEYNRERLRMETQIKMLEQYSKEVKKIYEEMLEIKVRIVKLVGTKKILNTYKDSPLDNENMEKEYNNLKYSFKKYNTNYIKNIFQSLLYTNSVLYHDDLQLEFPEYHAPDKVDKLLNYINSPLKEFDVKEFQDEFGELKKNGAIEYPDVNKCIKWLSEELANAHQGLQKLITKLDEDITE